MVCWLLYKILVQQRHTYEEKHDGLEAAPFALGSLVLAAVLHGDLDEIPLFDTLWMCGLFVSAVAVLPQLWMMTRRGGSTPALASHFIAVMAFSKILSGSYMWHACYEFDCTPWIGTFNHAGWSAVASQAVHMLLLADFAYLYIKNLATGGLRAPLEVPSIVDYV